MKIKNLSYFHVSTSISMFCMHPNYQKTVGDKNGIPVGMIMMMIKQSITLIPVNYKNG